MTKPIEQAGFVGLAIGFLLGMIFIGLLTAARNPLHYGRTCDEESEVAVLLAHPDGKSRQTACLEDWRVVNP